MFASAFIVFTYPTAPATCFTVSAQVDYHHQKLQYTLNLLPLSPIGSPFFKEVYHSKIQAFQSGHQQSVNLIDQLLIAI
ncbi:hypothetical protein J416_09749 [Gracilibacillus halophilus YIM-C55.5]|uniref:Uncharacterized protein n=1 Tax=Gracilibacillus halophilus YIM-C55.5 TaxID=1308866 RepID=N4WU65_9BACI|nr:hypothetical protein J416_09749 [Gracilibacillus halophilus YIM-C55.5]